MLFENFCRKNFSICALHQWDRGTTFNHPWKIRKENSLISTLTARSLFVEIGMVASQDISHIANEKDKKVSQ